MLTLLCGDTKKDFSTTNAHMSRLSSNGTILSTFWGSKLITVDTFESECVNMVEPCDGMNGGTRVRVLSWLPAEIEITFWISEAPPPSDKLFISSRVDIDVEGREDVQGWIICNGGSETLSLSPASAHLAASAADPNSWRTERFQLMTVISQIVASEESHTLLHIKVANESHLSSPLPEKNNRWMLFNDFMVQNTDSHEVMTFPSWRHPCVVCFSKQHPADLDDLSLSPSVPERPLSVTEEVVKDDWQEIVVPESVLSMPSLSQVQCVHLVPSSASPHSFGVQLPEPGGLIAFDGEFVSVTLEQTQINTNGQRVISEEGRQILARMSLLYGGKLHQLGDALSELSEEELNAPSTLLADDYILPLEPVLDYVTRFSGIVAEDLNPMTSKHAIITHRAAYLKLRYFIDRKFIFVGHGLQKDFETANIFVPPDQARESEFISLLLPDVAF